jgi:8-oxo-dGTP diphosphatase
MRQGEKETLKQDDPKHREYPSVAVDLVVFAVIDSRLHVLLTQRTASPFKGVWALPGGFVRVSNSGSQGEHIEDAAHRELESATTIPAHSCFIDQLHTFGKAGRDPRMRVITIAWYALLAPGQVNCIGNATDDTSQWFSTEEDVPWMRLAFDHAEILHFAVERIRSQIDNTDIAFELIPDTFTVAELQTTHEAVKARPHDSRNFRRRFQRMVDEGLVTAAPGKRHRGRARPAQVWRRTR